MQRAPRRKAKVTEKTNVSALIEDDELRQFDRLICYENQMVTRSEVLRFAIKYLYQRTVAGETGLILLPE